MDFTLKPVFVGWTTFLAQLPLQLFLTVFCAVFFGLIATALTAGLDGDFGEGGLVLAPGFVLFGMLAFFGVPAVIYIGKKMNYGRTEYRFCRDHLEFEEGFLTIRKKQIRYADVKEITLRKGLLQRPYGLGTIYLATTATGTTQESQPFSAIALGSASSSGISIRDVRDPDAVYENIRHIVSP
jgi:membrane protein YdbS with pleckstrin-like domain